MKRNDYAVDSAYEIPDKLWDRMSRLLPERCLSKPARRMRLWWRAKNRGSGVKVLNGLVREYPKKVVAQDSAEQLRCVAKMQGRRAAINAGLNVGLGVAAILTILAAKPDTIVDIVKPVNAIEYSTPNFNDFLDQSSNPSPPSSGLTRLFSKNGLLYTEDPVGVVNSIGGSPYNTASYIIYQSGGTTYALNGATGRIDYTNADPAVVISDAIAALTNGGKILIKAGTYILQSLNITLGGVAGSAAIGSTTVGGIELCGEGSGSTILQPATNLNGTIIGTLNVNNWFIHDLQVNGNRANQSGGGTNPQLTGMNLFNTTKTVVQNCYVHDCKTYGIQLNGTACKVLNNHVTNCNANGIIMYGGSQLVIAHNTVNGASDVGLDISGVSSSSPITDVTCRGNVVLNVNLAVSPFGLNTGEGILLGDNAGVNKAIVGGNVIDTCAGYGIASCPGSSQTNYDITLDSNEIYNCEYGLYIAATTNITVNGCIIDTLTGSGYNPAVNIVSTTTACLLSGLTFLNLPSQVSCIATGAAGTLIEGCYMTVDGSGAGPSLSIEGNNCQVLNNYFNGVSVGGATQCYGSGANSCIISGNNFAIKSGDYGVYLGGSCSNWIISNNIFNSVAGTAALACALKITAASCIDTQVTGNNFANCGAISSGHVIADNGLNTLITNNIGLNPLNQIGSPFNTTNNTIGTNGTTGTPVASTNYVVQGAALNVYWSGGTGVSVTILDGYNDVVVSAAQSPQRLPYGWKINFGAFSSAPTVTVYGE